MAKVLADPRYRKRIERKRKGKSSYIRIEKHKDRGSLLEAAK
jgi:stalled ribosome alternative rescue factor ArfA